MLQRYTIATRHFGDIHVLRPVPSPTDTWGELAPLRGTAWEEFVTVVSGDALSHALHGYARPLMDQLGPDPRSMLRKVSELGLCRLHGTCLMYVPADCRPSPKTPSCYLPPDVEPEAELPIAAVVQAWVEGRYVFVAEGPEFSL